MKRVHVICEGQTEETFVKELLIPHFVTQDIFLEASLIGKPGHKGGNITFKRLLADVQKLLKTSAGMYCTTFFDFYRLPNDFPGKQDAVAKTSILEKAETIKTHLSLGFTKAIGEPAIRRFIPYVQLHEFEGLLFSDPTKFAEGIDRPDLAKSFQQIRKAFQTPEDINDNPNTAPSKRVKQLVADYDKPVYGVLAALNIGLSVIRDECALFDAWLRELENLKDT